MQKRVVLLQSKGPGPKCMFNIEPHAVEVVSVIRDVVVLLEHIESKVVYPFRGTGIDNRILPKGHYTARSLHAPSTVYVYT